MDEYQEWENGLSALIGIEPVWKFIGYRKAMFLYDLVWKDTQGWLRDPRGRAIVDQIVRSVGSISANLEEGLGRGYGKELLYHYRVALASARESKGWYIRARYLLPVDSLTKRLCLLDEIIALIIAELSFQRKKQNLSR